MGIRKIVKIDETKCDGCGLCVPSCAEGAIRLIGGKARLVSEVYCDGLGACLGECPQGAITIEERDAREFDQAAVDDYLKGQTKPGSSSAGPAAASCLTAAPGHHGCSPAQAGGTHPAGLGRLLSGGAGHGAGPSAGGCPGAAMRDLRQHHAPVVVPPAPVSSNTDTPATSALSNWPVQLSLAPARAPYFENADLLISADCVAFAAADFHRRLLTGRILLVGCPKLDNGPAYLEKLTRIFSQNSIRSITVAHMEVPCCTGLIHLVQRALAASGKQIQAEAIQIGINGETLQKIQIG